MWRRGFSFQEAEKNKVFEYDDREDDGRKGTGRESGILHIPWGKYQKHGKQYSKGFEENI